MDGLILVFVVKRFVGDVRGVNIPIVSGVVHSVLLLDCFIIDICVFSIYIIVLALEFFAFNDVDDQLHTKHYGIPNEEKSQENGDCKSDISFLIIVQKFITNKSLRV